MYELNTSFAQLRIRVVAQIRSCNHIASAKYSHRHFSSQFLSQATLYRISSVGLDIRKSIVYLFSWSLPNKVLTPCVPLNPSWQHSPSLLSGILQQAAEISPSMYDLCRHNTNQTRDLSHYLATTDPQLDKDESKESKSHNVQDSQLFISSE